jgi:5'-AMP-activated protein kinase catalytic alpha subunit
VTVGKGQGEVLLWHGHEQADLGVSDLSAWTRALVSPRFPYTHSSQARAMFRKKPSTAAASPSASIPSSPILLNNDSLHGAPSKPNGMKPVNTNAVQTTTTTATATTNVTTANVANATTLSTTATILSTTATTLPITAARYTNGMVVEGEYRLERTIGKGSYGKVKLATQLSTGEKVALKFISRASIKKPSHWTRIRREINLLRALHHPHIVKLHEYRDNGADILLVMEYVQGGDLFDRIVHHRDQRFSEREARPLFRQIVSAVDYCHQNRIIHRDLKPENVMVDERNQVKLIDFGFANVYSPRGFLETNCGSPLYASPEIVQGARYVGPEVDAWSLGVILFAMLTGTLPFEDDQLKGLYDKIRAGAYTLPGYLSAEARDLLRIMLTVDPRQRATMKDIKFSAWVMNGSLYPPENFLPFRPDAAGRSGLTMASVREDVVAALGDYGFTDPHAATQMILYQPDSPAYALYCLLVEREQRLARAQRPSHLRAFPIGAGMSSAPLGASLPGSVSVSVPSTAPVAAPCASAPLTPIKQTPSPAIGVGVEYSPASRASPSSGSNLVAQAAAHVASRFRKLRDLNFGRTQVASGASVADDGLPRSIATASASAPFTIAIPSNGQGNGAQVPGLALGTGAGAGTGAGTVSYHTHLTTPYNPRSFHS